MLNVAFTGRLGAAPEVKDVGDNKVLKLRVAVPGRNGKEEVTTWLNVSYWSKGAEKLATFLDKGREVTIRGELTQREYVANGVTKTSLEVRADGLQLVGGKSDNSHAKTRASNTDPDRGNGGGGGDDEIPFISCSVDAETAAPRWERW